MSYKLQQLGLGGILDQTIAIIRDNFGLLARIMLFMTIPFSLVVGYVAATVFPTTSTIFPTPEQQAQTEAAMLQHWPFFLVVGLLSVFVVMPVTNAAVIQAAAHLYLGKSITAGRAIKDGFALWPALIGTAILYYLAVIGGTILLIIPGIIFALWFVLSQHVVVIEGTSGPAALGRSRTLVRGHIGTLIALGVVMYVISALIGFIPNFIPQMHLRIVGSTLAQALTGILWTVSGVVYYFSCRCANENFDLHYLAQAMGDERSGDAAAHGNS